MYSVSHGVRSLKMRRFRNLSKSRQKELSIQFPDLYKLVCFEETPHYSYLAVSVFDHWLTREEGSALLENVSEIEQEKRNSALYSFSRMIASETEVLNFKFSGKWRSCSPLFRSFSSEQAKLEYLKPAISVPEKRFFQVLLPEFGAVFLENWDDTNILFLRDKSVEERVRTLATACGVYCLKKWT